MQQERRDSSLKTQEKNGGEIQDTAPSWALSRTEPWEEASWGWNKGQIVTSKTSLK